MTYKEIINFLPHRYPMLYVDDIVEVEYGSYAKGIKNITNNEPWCQGHFPDEPIFPGIFMIEIMAQVGGFIFFSEELTGFIKKYYLVKVENAKFIGKVVPGNQIVVEARVMSYIGNYIKLKSVAYVGNNTVAEAIIMLCIANGDEEENEGKH